MQHLMSRYGGYLFYFEHVRVSYFDLPDNQSPDYMIAHYAKELIPNWFYISTYDAMPYWMGSKKWKDFDKAPVKIGTLTHDFLEILLHKEVTVKTDVYIATNTDNGNYAVIIKTHKQELKEILSNYKVCFDYVLHVTIKDDTIQPLNNTKDIECLLMILFYKMGLIYKGSIKKFAPSKTKLGKLITDEFCRSTKKRLINVDSDEKLAELLMALKA
jgi:hypothetical protein